MRQRKKPSSTLRHRLLLQQETEVADGAGGYVRSWTNIGSVWGRVVPTRGRERLFAGKLQAETTHKILLRYRNDITPRHRLVLNNRIFAIYSIRNIDEIDRLLEVMVVEGEQD